MSFVAVIKMYGDVCQLLPLKASNPADAAREAYARCFCKSAGHAIPEDYNGNAETHQCLLNTLSDKFIYQFLENLNREKWSDTGALQSVIPGVPNSIRIFEVVGIHPCDGKTMYADWFKFISAKVQTLTDTEKQAEIDRLEQELADKQAQLQALKKKP